MPPDRPAHADPWRCLFDLRRPQLGQLQSEPLSAAATPALQAAWQVEVQRLPHEAERLLRRQPVPEPALRELLAAAIAEQYDDAQAARALAEQAMAELPDPLDARHLWAQRLLGMAWLESGEPQRALQPLQDCLRGAHRDGLVLLRLDALRVLARVQQQLGGSKAAAPWVEQGLALLASLAPDWVQALPAAASLRRQQLQHLQEQALISGQTAPGAQPATPSAADQLLAAQALRLNGDAAAARALAGQLSLQAAQHYWPLKWQLELAQLRSRLGLPSEPALLSGPAARRHQRPLSLSSQQAEVQEALQARAAGRPWPAPRLDALAQRLQSHGLVALQCRLALARAGNSDDLAAWWWLPARDPLDLLSLATALLPLVQVRLKERLPRDERLAWQGLLPQLIGPRESPIARQAQVPPGLTRREWQVLQLIGDRCSNAQIAAQLGLGEATVKTHINRLYAKLDLRDRLQAMQAARRLASEAPVA